MLSDDKIDKTAREFWDEQNAAMYAIRIVAFRFGAVYARAHYDREIKILRDALEQVMVIEQPGYKRCEIAYEALKQCDSQNSTESTDAGAEVNHE